MIAKPKQVVGMKLDTKMERKTRKMRENADHLKHPQISNSSEKAKNAKVGC